MQPFNTDDVHIENREFIVSGQTFHWRTIPWEEEGARVDKAIADAIAKENELDEKRKEAEAEGREFDEEDVTPKVMESLETVIKNILYFTEEEERPRLEEALRSKEKPVSVMQMNVLHAWLREVQTERPTTPPGDSSPGDGDTGPTSQGA